MPPNENICRETLRNIRKLLGIAIIKPFLSKIKSSENRYYQTLKMIFDENCFIKAFNHLHGQKNTDAIFINIINERYQTDSSLFQEYLQSDRNNMSAEYISSINNLCIEANEKYNVYIGIIQNLRKEERKHAEFLKQLKLNIVEILDEGKLRNTKLATFNINEMIQLYDKINKNLKTDNVIKVYKDCIHGFRECYVFYLANKQKIASYYINSKVSNTFFGDKKMIENHFMKPVLHVFNYPSIFQSLGHNCFKNERSYQFLENSFRDIIGMANEKKRTIEGNDYLESIKARIIWHGNTINEDLLFYINDSFIFRRNKNRYLVMFFTNQFAIFLKKSGNIEYLEKFDYDRIKKCKVYHDEKSHIKIVYEAKEREILVFPIDEIDKADRIVSYISNHIENLNETKKNDVSIKDDCFNEIAAKVEFSDLYFLIKFNPDEGFIKLKRKIIARVGQKFFPDKNINEDNIDLNHYLDFNFSIRDKGNLYLLENNEDLHAAIVLNEGKLDIVIKSSKTTEEEISSI